MNEMDLYCARLFFEKKCSSGAGCNAGHHMTDQHSSPNSIQTKAQMGKQVSQGHANDDVIKNHSEHAFRGLAHAVERTEIAVRNGIQDVPDADNQEIRSHDGRYTVALDEQARKLFGKPDHENR